MIEKEFSEETAWDKHKRETEPTTIFFQLTPEEFKNLDALRSLAKAEEFSVLFQNSLSLYQSYLLEKAKGGRLAVIRGNRVLEIELPY